MGWFKKLLGLEDTCDHEDGPKKNIVVTIRDGEVTEEVLDEITEEVTVELIDIEDRDFSRLLAAVTNEAHDSGRVNLIRMSIKMGKKFTADQARFLAEAFDQDENRARIVIPLYSAITDKENFIVVLGTFDFGYYKEKVMRELELI